MSQPTQPSVHVVCGTWSRTSSELENRDIYSQVVTANPIVLPYPIHTHSLSEPSHIDVEGTDPIDEFFGVSRSYRGTQDSRHDTFHSSVRVDSPPPYFESDLPAYTPEEPCPTLAEYLFKYGFLFPLFWIAGACILMSPLNASEDWESGKTAEERGKLLVKLRCTEIKWAKRCLIALAVLVAVAAVIAIAAVTVRHS